MTSSSSIQSRVPPRVVSGSAPPEARAFAQAMPPPLAFLYFSYLYLFIGAVWCLPYEDIRSVRSSAPSRRSADGALLQAGRLHDDAWWSSFGAGGGGAGGRGTGASVTATTGIPAAPRARAAPPYAGRDPSPLRAHAVPLMALAVVSVLSARAVRESSLSTLPLDCHWPVHPAALSF